MGVFGELVHYTPIVMPDPRSPNPEMHLETLTQPPSAQACCLGPNSQTLKPEALTLEILKPSRNLKASKLPKPETA